MENQFLKFFEGFKGFEHLITLLVDLVSDSPSLIKIVSLSTGFYFSQFLNQEMSGSKFPSAINLPIIDFKNVYSGGQKRTSEADNLIKAFTEFGFCLISNVPDYNLNEVHEAIK